MTCPHCGYEENWSRNFCSNCRKSLLDEIPQDDGIVIKPWSKGDAKGCMARISFCLILFIGIVGGIFHVVNLC